MQVHLKRVKLMLVVSTAALLAFLFSGRSGAYQQKTEIAGIDAPMSERLGADDKPSLVVHFTGDIHGSLEPCG